MLQIPEGYKSALDVLETQAAIAEVRSAFQRNIAAALNLRRISAPMFVRPESGLNDNLNGVERPVSFDIPSADCTVEVVHSLAKWKRLALKRYGFKPGEGLYTDMNAIRRDEELDNLHSVYVDQWDWEKVITREQRTEEYLRETVKAIVGAIHATELEACAAYPALTPYVGSEVYFIGTDELEAKYPELTPKERENAVCREHGTTFISKIGGALPLSGKPHDGRAPDYDDWSLNGDILIWYPPLERALELSSMGIRVDETSLASQLAASGHEERRELAFHSALLAGELPLTIGGGIGQSRVCMALLGKAHVGEVQASVWPDDMIAACEAAGIRLL
jgi:aspartate--ammonia ligase